MALDCRIIALSASCCRTAASKPQKSSMAPAGRSGVPRSIPTIRTSNPCCEALGLPSAARTTLSHLTPSLLFLSSPKENTSNPSDAFMWGLPA